MGKAQQQVQRSYVAPLLFIIGISLLVLYFSGTTASGEVVRRTSGTSLFAAAPSPPNPLPIMSTHVELSLQGSLDSYWIAFTNRQGTRYFFRYLSSFNNIYKYGDVNNELVFVEALSSTAGNIGLNDYFVLSNQRSPSDVRAVSHVLQYTNFDPIQRTVTFVEQEPTRNTKTFTYQLGNPNPYPAMARLIFSGNTYLAYIDPQGNLAIDMNANGALQGTKINLVAYESVDGGQFTPVVLDLGTSAYSGNRLTIPMGTQIPFTMSQGDPSQQQVMVDSLRIKPAQVTLNNVPLTLLQLETIKGPYPL